MPKPENLPSFPGWKPLEWEEPFGLGDKLVCTNPWNAHGTKFRATPEHLMDDSKWEGRTMADNWNGNLNKDYYGYRRTGPRRSSTNYIKTSLPLP